ncbi:MAG: RNA pseudouridine synthase [Saprospiraceae bacterium]|nr:RNA pseudouridine synthase [Saprospiraceae bacterium]
MTIPDRFNTNAPSVISILSKQFETVIPVHRLDKNTSGVVLFAKSAEMHKKMSLLFENREVAKYYVAIVDGRVVPTEGIIHAPLAESMTQRGKMVINKRGKESTTEYKVITQFKRFAYVSLKLLTGRMHQIRVHMLHIGHPLVVDHLYGNRENLCLSEIKQKIFYLELWFKKIIFKPFFIYLKIYFTNKNFKAAHKTLLGILLLIYKGDAGGQLFI